MYNGNRPLPSPKPTHSLSSPPSTLLRRSPLCGGLRAGQARRRSWREAGEGGRQLQLRGKSSGYRGTPPPPTTSPLSCCRTWHLVVPPLTAGALEPRRQRPTRDGLRVTLLTRGNDRVHAYRHQVSAGNGNELALWEGGPGSPSTCWI
jgi:hypothetical protein